MSRLCWNTRLYINLYQLTIIQNQMATSYLTPNNYGVDWNASLYDFNKPNCGLTEKLTNVASVAPTPDPEICSRISLKNASHININMSLSSGVKWTSFVKTVEKIGMRFPCSLLRGSAILQTQFSTQPTTLILHPLSHYKYYHSRMCCGVQDTAGDLKIGSQ